MATRGHAKWTEEQKTVARLVRELRRLGKYLGPNGVDILKEDLADMQGQLSRLTEDCPSDVHLNPYADKCPICSGGPTPFGKVMRGSVEHVAAEPPKVPAAPSTRHVVRRRAAVGGE